MSGLPLSDVFLFDEDCANCGENLRRGHPARDLDGPKFCSFTCYCEYDFDEGELPDEIQAINDSLEEGSV